MKEKIDLKNVAYAVGATLATATFALLASFFTDSDSEWFTSLEKGPLMPPDVAFGIAWGILYILLAISFAAVLITTQGKGWVPYLLNLALLALWCYVFFYRQNIDGGLLLLIILVAYSLLLFWYAYKRSKLAGWLLIPYILWLGYAAAINYQTAILN